MATTGSDTGAGTISQPFRTIQRAASAAVAGDTVTIRAGVYRETVRPANSGSPGAAITFQGAAGELVTVSGADVIASASWSRSSGNIYKATMGWDLGDGLNQVFLDGQMMIEARWPNTTLDVSRPTAALTGNGSSTDATAPALSTGTITGLDLPARSAGYWNGATLHISPFNVNYTDNFQGAGWTWQTGTVVDATASQMTFTWLKWVTFEDAITPGPKNPFYLSGKLGELDAAGEWFRDAAASALYLWTPAGDSPATPHVVEAKRRPLAFDLSGRSFITIRGLSVFAASITSDEQSQYLTLDGLNVTYVSHNLLTPNGGASFLGVNNSGILLNGKNHVLKNSVIAFSSGNGVQLVGAGHRVLNNVVHDANYAGTEASPIAAGFNSPATNNFFIAWNTIYNAGRHGILHTNTNPGTGRGKILHNVIYNYGIQTTDLGCVYSYGSDGNGTEIGYNVCHDDSGTHLGAGLYMDFDSSNYVAHHNVVWSTQGSIRMNSVSRNNKVYNNTFAGGVAGRGLAATPGRDGTYQMPGSELKNNIFTMALSPLVANSGAVQQTNTLPPIDPQFVDSANGNYQLRATSPSVDAGTVLAPYTDGFSGRAPDVGAYESGVPAWKAGAGQGIAVVEPNGSSIPWLSAGAVALATLQAPPTATGTKVTVTDGAGVERAAQVMSIVSNRVTFVIPNDTTGGVVVVTITSGDGTVSLGSTSVF